MLDDPDPDQPPLLAMSFPIQIDPRQALPVRLHLYSGPQPESPDQADPSKLLGTFYFSRWPVSPDLSRPAPEAAPQSPHPQPPAAKRPC